MSLDNVEDKSLSSRSLDDIESPRKRLETSSRKGWTLLDRKTDQEVLQEMGVSILDPDDGEAQCDVITPGTLHKSATKRKHDIENVNPNANSPRPSPKSPRGKGSPAPGPSRVKSPRSADKGKPLQPTDNQLLETTLVHQYIIDEETPLAQSVSGQYVLGHGFGAGSGGSGTSGGTRRSYTPVPLDDEQLFKRISPPLGEDLSAALSDEMLLSIFRWLPKRTLAHCMLLCRRWHRVACDETLWQRLDLGGKMLAKDALGRILARKPIIVRLASSQIGEWRPTTNTPSRIQYLDLSMATIDRTTLNCLLDRCPQLKKLSLESVPIEDDTCEIIGKCSKLETLNLTMVEGITADGLKSILDGCTGLLSVNISWCGLTEAALLTLVTSLPPRLQRLNVGGARTMSDDMVSTLVSRCPRLLELDLSDCSKLGAASVTSLLALSRLDHLALSRCYLLPPHVFTKLSAMPSLQYLEVWGMLASLAALRVAMPAIQVNQFMFSAIARPTVGSRRTSIWGLRTRD